MEKQAFLNDLKELVKNEEILSINKDVNELKGRFEDFIIEEERKKQVAILDARANGEDVEYEVEVDPIKDEFYEIFKSFKANWSKALDEKKSVQQENLRQKRVLISKLKSLIENEEHIGSAFNTFKEIQENWKTIGEIEREKRAEIQSEFSKLVEDFFYNMKIYKELKEHDFHRNLQHKLEIISKIKNLLSLDTIKEIESSIKTYQHEWDEIGPVNQDKWEEIRTEYYDSVRNVYAKINEHYDVVRQLQADNIDKKQALLVKTQELIASLDSIDSSKGWDEKTNELLETQNYWKTIGFGPKKENEEVWQAFRSECDKFFSLKKAFYEKINEKFEGVAEKKRNLIQKANEIKDSTDWKKTSDKFIELQKKWKELGNAGQKFEQKLWKDFRAACDYFFNAKQNHFNSLDKENESNLTLKLDLISKIESFELPEDKNLALNSLKDFSNQFNAIGHVPMKEKDNVYNKYKTAIDKHYKDLKLEGEEKEKVLFLSKIETLKASPNAHKLLDRERGELRKQIDLLKQDIIQFENNLGFFAKSKGATELKKEVEKKIDHSKRKIDELTRKIKMIVNEQVH